MVNVKVMWLGLVFVLIYLAHMHGVGGVSFKIGRPKSRGEKILNVDGKDE